MAVSQASTHHYHLRLLGSIRIERDGQPIERLESRKALGVLCYLCSESAPVSRSQLVNLFWPEKTERRARGNLSRVLHNISRQMPSCIEANRQEVHFVHHDRVWLDLIHFRVHAASPRTHQLTAAAELFRGEFLENLEVNGCPDFDLWMTAKREEWRQQLIQLFQTLSIHYTERGEYSQALRYIDRLLDVEPWKEEVHRQKMLLLHMDGQRSAALAQFDHCRDLLQRELQLPPSSETVRLHQQIKELRGVLTGAIQSQGPTEPLIERGDAHSWLVRRWEDARRGLGNLTVIEGEAGVGKTALINEVLAYASSHGALVLRSSCYQYDSEMPYEAFINALRPLFTNRESTVTPDAGAQPERNFELADIELAEGWWTELVQLWPEAHPGNAPPPPATDDPIPGRHRLFEAIAQFLSAVAAKERELIIFLDDLHRAEASTLDLLRYLFHRLHRRAIWFVSAFRREETTPNHPLTFFRNVLLRENHLLWTALQPLSADGVMQVLRQYHGVTMDHLPILGQILQEQSEGNPFVLSEIRKTLEQRQVLSVDEIGNWHVDRDQLQQIHEAGLSVPDPIAALMQNRLSRLSARSRRLLQVAAVLGCQFDFQELLRVSGEPGEWIEVCLASWIGRRLVVELPLSDSPGRTRHAYRFGHNMLWRVVLDELTPLQRLRLDDRVAGQPLPHPAQTTSSATVRRIEELGD